MSVYADTISDFGYRALWTGQSFQVESHMALASIAARPIPVGIGTALAPLRTPFDAALQVRSLAALLNKQVSVAYGASDPAFVTAIRGRPLPRPASFTAEYARLVKGLVAGEMVSSDFPGLEMENAQLPDIGKLLEIEVGTGVLREGMAKRSSGIADFVVTWLTPRNYIKSALLPALDVRRRPRLVSMVHVAVERRDRNPYLLAQTGCGNHLRRQHYSDMLTRAGIRNHPTDIAAGARGLVENSVFLFGHPDYIVEQLNMYGDLGVDEVVLNTTAVATLHGDQAAVEDLHEIANAAALKA